jgi:gamma-butyrobetaine dioxygenase
VNSMVGTGASCDIDMTDLAPMPTAHTIAALEYNVQGVTLQWDDGLRSRFPALWLRDNCACPQCRHPKALERTFMFIDHPAPSIASAVLRDNAYLEIQFRAETESHISRYTKGWLRIHDYSESEVRKRQRAPQLWDSGFAPAIPSVNYADYMHMNAGLRAWIEAVNRYGIVLLQGVPQERGQVLPVARRIGPVRITNFGEYYDVVSMADPNASAYTQMGLELHTDLANWRVPPDIQLLSCLKNSVIGGESIFADGFRVAEDLRAMHTQAFKLLSTHPIVYRFHDDRCDIRASAPVIELDGNGGLVRIRFNNGLRAAMVGPEIVIEAMYKALETFWRLLRNPKYRLMLRLQPGELIAYNNNRVLHGRTSFDATSGERQLQGCYLNQEDVDSALRLLDRSQV